MIGIRREDKSVWEARSPLVPADVRQLVGGGVPCQVQTSPLRRFRDDEYRTAGAAIVDELTDPPVILGVKEIPVRCLAPDKTYVFFSHTVKGQPHNMPMLRRIVELGCTLIDYERIVDDQGRRLVFFGRFAGLAGMIDTLWALGRRLQYEGHATPFLDVKRAYEYHDLVDARAGIAAVGERIAREGLPQVLQPFVCGFTGYGHVSQGAQEIFDLLRGREITPAELPNVRPDPHTCYKVVFREEHMVAQGGEHKAPALSSARGGADKAGALCSPARAADALRSMPSAFDLQDYYTHPERYRGTFFDHVPHLSVLVNCIYWDARYPRLLTCEQVRDLWSGPQPPRLRIIGDISCDLNGSNECTVKATEPGEPVYVWEPATGAVRDGVAGSGPVVLAVDILPCELPVDASTYFGHTLRPFVPALDRADYSRPLDKTGLPPELQRAVIALRGELTPAYRYLEEKLKQ
jgi:saccharopine dehydrogenase (NAD+, L-lysine forming)